MITGVRSVGLYVKNQDRAKHFFTETLGFDLLRDAPMGEGDSAPRWIEVAPKDRKVILVLFTPEGQEDRIGTFSNVIFDCENIESTYAELANRGVEFPDAPRREVWGWWSMFKDPDGNTYGLGQHGE